MLKRTYHVVAIYDGGTFTWESYVGGFLPFQCVSSSLIKQWRGYAENEVGKSCAIVNFIRIEK